MNLKHFCVENSNKKEVNTSHSQLKSQKPHLKAVTGCNISVRGRSHIGVSEIVH